MKNTNAKLDNMTAEALERQRQGCKECTNEGLEIVLTNPIYQRALYPEAIECYRAEATNRGLKF